jgi:predicted  nucleic acid-binding Zn-ribbon protein
MQSELIATLQEANREIRGLVSKLSGKKGEACNAALLPGELQALSRKLARIAKQLSHVPPTQPKEEALQAAISEYAGNLETLKAALEGVQDALGKRRDQLKRDLDHMNSTRAWVKAFRSTH